MSEAPNTKNYKSVVYRVAVFQLVISVAIASALLVGDGVRTAYSALLAGVISAAMTAYMGRKILSVDSTDGFRVLSTVYVAEFIKLIFIATFFSLAFLVFNVHGAAFLGTYLVTVLIFAVMLAFPGLLR